MARSHYVLVQSEADLNDELKAWLQEAHDIVGFRATWGHKSQGVSSPPAPRYRTPIACLVLTRWALESATTRQIRVNGEDRAVGYSDEVFTPGAPTRCSPKSSACSR